MSKETDVYSDDRKVKREMGEVKVLVGCIILERLNSWSTKPNPTYFIILETK